MEKVLAGIMGNQFFFPWSWETTCQRKYPNNVETKIEKKWCAPPPPDTPRPTDPPVRPPSPVPSRPARINFVFVCFVRSLFRHFPGYFFWQVFSHSHGFPHDHGQIIYMIPDKTFSMVMEKLFPQTGPTFNETFFQFWRIFWSKKAIKMSNKSLRYFKSR